RDDLDVERREGQADAVELRRDDPPDGVDDLVARRGDAHVPAQGCVVVGLDGLDRERAVGALDPPEAHALDLRRHVDGDALDDERMRVDAQAAQRRVLARAHALDVNGWRRRARRAARVHAHPGDVDREVRDVRTVEAGVQAHGVGALDGGPEDVEHGGAQPREELDGGRGARRGAEGQHVVGGGLVRHGPRLADDEGRPGDAGTALWWWAILGSNQ